VKNIGNVVILIGIVLFCFILQMYVFNNFKIFGVKANVLLTLCVILAVWNKPNISIPFSFFIGVISDLLFFFSIGKYLIAYVILTLIIITVSSFYNRESKGATALIVIITTIIAEYILGIFSLIKFGVLTNFFSATFVGIKGALINAIIAIILSKIIKRIGEGEN